MQLRLFFLALSAASALKRAGLEDSLAAAEAATSAGLSEVNVVVNGASTEAAEAAEADRADVFFLKSAWGCLVRELQQLQNTSLPAGSVAQRADAIVADKIGAVDAASKGLTGKAMLMPELGMLNGMYAEQKERISALNRKEQKSKDRFLAQQKHHEQSLAYYKELLDDHKLSQGLYANATKDEDWQFSYFVRCRNRAHASFHTQLKLTHGLMAKEKGMVSAYNTALAPSSATKAQPQAQPQAVPEIVLLQGRGLAEYCQEAMLTAREQMTSLEAPRSSK